MGKKNNKKKMSKTLTIRFSPDSAPQSIMQIDALNLVSRLINEKRPREALFVAQQVADGSGSQLAPKLALLSVLLFIDLKAPAVELAQKLVAKYPRDKDVLRLGGEAMRIGGKIRQAIDLGEKAIRLYPSSAVLHNHLAVAYQDLGSADQAVKYYNKALSLSHGTLYDVYWNRATLVGDSLPEEELEKMRVRLEQCEPGSMPRAFLAFSIASACKKNYPDQQFQFLIEANDIVKSLRPWSESPYQEHLRRFPDYIAKTDFSNYRRKPTCDKTPIFIAGMPRSGTTLVEQIISSHDHVTPLGEASEFTNVISKVASHFNMERPLWEWVNEGNLSSVMAAIDEMFCASLENFEIATPYFTEKSISNTLWAGLQLKLYPDSRVVYCQRHPLDIICSCYQLYFPPGNDFVYSLESLANYYLITKRIMAKWMELFPERIIAVEYENLATNQEAETRRIIEFCGLEWQEECLFFYKQDRAARTASSLQVRQPMFTTSIAKWRPYAEYLQPAADILNIDLSTGRAS